jgi:hypothetical protein
MKSRTEIRPQTICLAAVFYLTTDRWDSKRRVLPDDLVSYGESESQESPPIPRSPRFRP